MSVPGEQVRAGAGCCEDVRGRAAHPRACQRAELAHATGATEAHCAQSMGNVYFSYKGAFSKPDAELACLESQFAHVIWKCNFCEYFKIQAAMPGSYCSAGLGNRTATGAFCPTKLHLKYQTHTKFRFWKSQKSRDMLQTAFLEAALKQFCKFTS